MQAPNLGALSVRPLGSLYTYLDMGRSHSERRQIHTFLFIPFDPGACFVLLPSASRLPMSS